ncbi:SRPBCC family protein [Nocardioides lijunqiniae]|uniref:SRPBCC family protein n=1 Tax=Nocardioides lijunqiniae TaxID=2760832 RepID=UPI00187897AD|nr:SRPBCC family protein [Nocardioides lijunqiniae]
MHVERTFTVPRPVEEVFDYLADFTHTEAWDPGTVSTTRTGGDGGVGTTYANTSRFVGRTVELTYETLTHDRPHRLVFRGRNASATATDTLTFATAGEGTTMHYRADFDFGRLGNLLFPLFVRGKIDRLADDTVAQMSRTLS